MRPTDRSRVRLLALDIDGTILRTDGGLAERTRHAVLRAQEAGLHVALVTGRHPQETEEIVQALGLSGLIACCNGAMVCRPDNGEIISQATIDLDAGILATLELQRLGVYFYHYMPEGILVPRRHAGRFGLGPGRPRVVVVEDAADYLQSRGAGVLMMNVPDLSSADDQALRRHLSGPLGGRLTVAYTQAHHMDILPPGRSKAAGLVDVAAYLGLRPAEIVAVGDNLNDLPMLQFAGLGVAMGNASAEVRAGADRVIGTNDEDGVAAFIEGLLRG